MVGKKVTFNKNVLIFPPDDNVIIAPNFYNTLIFIDYFI